MAEIVKKDKVSVKGKVVSIGIDVHKVSWRITAIVEGVVVLSVTAKPNYVEFKKVLTRFEGAKIRVAYEAGQAGFDLYDKLSADGIECIVTPPSLIPTESNSFDPKIPPSTLRVDPFESWLRGQVLLDTE